MRKTILPFFAFILAWLPNNSFAENFLSPTEAVLGEFELICLGYLTEKPEYRMEYRTDALETLSDKELTPKEAKAFLYTKKGRVWKYEYKSEAYKASMNYMVALTDDNACSVIAPKFSSKAVKSGFLENVKSSEEYYLINFLGSEKKGSLTKELYKLDYPALSGWPNYDTAYFEIITSAKSSEGITLTVIPRTDFLKNDEYKTSKPKYN
jgi:hypothetical protein